MRKIVISAFMLIISIAAMQPGYADTQPVPRLERESASYSTVDGAVTAPRWPDFPLNASIVNLPEWKTQEPKKGLFLSKY